MDKILKREKFLHWEKAVAIMIQVARGLKHAHEVGIIHRDIKPATIVLCRAPGLFSPEDVAAGLDFVAKILDLGLSKNVGSGQTPFTGTTGAAVMVKHLTEQLVNPQDIRPEIPDGVAHVIMNDDGKGAGRPLRGLQRTAGRLGAGDRREGAVEPSDRGGEAHGGAAGKFPLRSRVAGCPKTRGRI